MEIEQDDKTGTHYALVEYKLAESVEAVVSSKRMHRIDGCRVQVKTAEPWHQSDHILNVLDDDCLREILSHLNQSDLINAANVCMRFNEQAKSIFSNKIKQLNLIKCSYEEAQKSLDAFGSLAQSIHIKANFSARHEVKILSTIARCCTSKLKELQFHDFRFKSKLPDDVDFDSALNKLEKLSLNYCHLPSNLNNLLCACVDLKMLNINGGSNDPGIRIPKFDKLEELRLDVFLRLNKQFLHDIIVMNTSLKRIRFRVFDPRFPYRDDIMRTIVQNHPNLHELDCDLRINTFFDDFTGTTNCLDGLKSLRVFKFNLNGKSTALLVAVLTTNATTLEHLELTNGKVDADTVKIISQMKHLNVLGLHEIDGLTGAHMIELRKGLGAQLENMKLIGSTAQSLRND